MLREYALPVAQYLRMSTEHQQYSTANQSIAILQYAQDHNMEIVRTYADHGKSGLSLATRHGLQQLLREAVQPNVDFHAILVYDVSRWGRFQNPDQAASYEYTLQTANIPIHYCAEPFQNDGSLASAILKTLKRGMAGEYSRELSVKVWAGHRRITELGYKIGGYAGYGLRRQLVGQDGTMKQVLHPGDRKSLQSEHVILIPGPPDEIAMIHRIYEMYIEHSMTEREIAAQLNHEEVQWIGGRPWTRMCVRHILSNPKYIGASVYNRRSFKLHKKVVQNPREEWIWRDGAFEPVVSMESFAKAREVLLERARTPSTEDFLDGLRALIEREGRASQRLIDSTEGIPSAGTYATRFGSLRNAYALAGWKPSVQHRLISTGRMVREIQRKIVERLLEATTDFDGKFALCKRTQLLTTDAGICLSLVVTRCSPDKGGRKYWHIYSPGHVPADLHLVVRLTQTNDSILDFFVFPNGMLKNSRLSVGRVNAVALEGYRFESLGIVSGLLRSCEIEEALGDAPEVGLSRGPNSSKESYRAQLTALQGTMARLFADEDFRNLLRVENCSKIPDVLRRQLIPSADHLALAICQEYVARLLKRNRVTRFIERSRDVTLKDLSPRCELC